MPLRHGAGMEATPSIFARVSEFGAALFGSASGTWGTLSALTPILAEFVEAFMPDRTRAWVRARLPSTPAHRRAVFLAIGALLLLIAAFQASDEVNGKLRAAQAELGQAKAELAQLKSGEARQHLDAEAARRLAHVSGQLSRFHSQAMDLWGAEITREQYPVWAQHHAAFVDSVTAWVESNLGASAKDALLAKPAFPDVVRRRFVDPAQEQQLMLLDSIAQNIRGLMRDHATNLLNPAASAPPRPPR